MFKLYPITPWPLFLYCFDFIFAILFFRVPNNDDNTTRPKSPEIKDVTPQLGVKTTGGLANILNQIGKKSKMTILEKSKQDWDGYKKKEGIVEELITHNKGKDGFVLNFSFQIDKEVISL